MRASDIDSKFHSCGISAVPSDTGISPQTQPAGNVWSWHVGPIEIYSAAKKNIGAFVFHVHKSLFPKLHWLKYKTMGARFFANVRIGFGSSGTIFVHLCVIIMICFIDTFILLLY